MIFLFLIFKTKKMSIKNLRYFVRLDARGKIVPGSLISRNKRPQSSGGTFMEIFSPKCCPDTVVSATPTGIPSATTEVTVNGFCDGTKLFTYVAVSASLADTVSKLTANFPAVATWAVSGTSITATSPICDNFTFNAAYTEP